CWPATRAGCASPATSWPWPRSWPWPGGRCRACSRSRWRPCLRPAGGIAAGAAWDAPAHLAALAAALAATLVYGLLGAACALVLRSALAGVVALLAYGLLGELVLAPQWVPASGWR